MPHSTLRPALILLFVLTLVTGIAYPLLITGLARIAFADASAGSLVRRGGVVVGSRLIGQNFTRADYFWGRPSATTPFPYNVGASGASNLGPLNPALAEGVAQRLAALRDGAPAAPVPVDLVTASGSGLDPDISIAAARFQIPRIEQARKIPREDLARLVEHSSHHPVAGFLGTPRVNVLELNLALDAYSSGPQ